MEKLKSEVDRMNSDEEFVKFLSDEKETELLINTYRDEGYDKGEIAGIQKIAREMLKYNIDINIICKYTKLSKDEIEDLK